MLPIYEIIWKERFADKIRWKHRVEPSEVEDVLYSRPYARRAQKGRVHGEDVYAASGQTEEGRYLVIFFVYKQNQTAIPISARDMTASERRLYEKRGKKR